MDKRTERIKKILAAILLSVISMHMMCGCADIDGKIPGEKEVLRYVKRECPTEEFTLVGKKEVSGDNAPDAVEYTFASKERDLKFKAVSTRQQFFCESASAWYFKKVYCNYKNVVMSQYTSAVYGVMQASPLYQEEEKGFFFTSFAQLETIAGVLADAQSIYRQELQYNSEEYLRENLNDYVRIYGIKPSVAESTSDSDLTGYSEIMSYVKENDFSRKLTTFVTNMDISVMEYDEIYDMLATEVTDCYMNELIYLEDKVPQEYLARWYHEKFNDD